MEYAKEINGTIKILYKNQIPDENGISGLKYSSNEILANHGWYPYTQETLGVNQKYGEPYFDSDNNVFTRDVEDVPVNDFVPEIISKLNFKLGLLTNHGITNAMVDQVISQVPDPIQKEMLNLLWYESTTIDRTDPEILQFAPILGLTEEDLEVICRDFENAR